MTTNQLERLTELHDWLEDWGNKLSTIDKLIDVDTPQDFSLIYLHVNSDKINEINNVRVYLTPQELIEILGPLRNKVSKNLKNIKEKFVEIKIENL